ncbi:hypothetical protein EVAR_94278_1 [Eumeta japonica]|uniref:Uncharacterized protein n=1 Tax=Eumeta variegata TaxID=151549 RepID=A0A4C1UGE1_EUMVA|nr:hypothetical protein EVAR_94278_1 [Eumeta japonica]
MEPIGPYLGGQMNLSWIVVATVTVLVTTVFKGQTSIRAIRENVVIAAHVGSQPHRNHQCTTSLLGANRISDREGMG